MSGKSPAYLHRRKNSAKPASAWPAAGFLNRAVAAATIPLCRRIFAVPCLRWVLGNRDEESGSCSGDRRDIVFVRGSRAGARRQRGAGRGVRGGRVGTGGRGGRCGDRLYGGTLDRAVLGNWPVGVAIARAACNSFQSCRR